ncbi:hypothetical protein LJ046_01785 [Lactobacillus delbrueckii subsp. jakobsenii ZN7a-9 = DSM 26046]|uniref:hypothetical protein n=1 Tax=Lactobacillus delbrueckii TaxID=1584 RepID=UPI000330FFDD|nr:hypothetical protein [Lactobacillus delbrueckii]APG72512.1 hypothetical protein LJ046_01785 [Lactobacillus delbrueckii subsp. jakobsenii ZN7a-9 = DSM 26046]EOD02986.1 hypothetical protein B506_03548 [Lactobacillus delbrueckii subsp. jakobsenii ZN7a-9 = DSM 26046]KRO18822.1 hypothetical protein IV58_GL000208 [Lactobacillus delbrueckii subsp. jakobsenii ZN7a-9 = DSM 26046]MBW9308665.1 hypothetical protein [Lactobacillus delbrueckii]TDG61742.1 hypothetical protein C5L19_000736 [Lactobacillus d
MKSNKNPFYKQWWAVTIAFIFVFFVGYIFGSAASSSDDSNDEASVASSSKSSSKSTTDDKSSEKNNAKKTLTVSYKNYEISSEKTFKPNYTNNSWAGGSVSVDSITLYKTAKAYNYDSANDGKFTIQGFMQIHYVIKTKADVSVYPTQGTYIYSNGEQHGADSTESWDGDISKNVTKQGTVTVPVEKISSVNSVRVKFDASAQDVSDDSLDHDFDFTITLS